MLTGCGGAPNSAPTKADSEGLVPIATLATSPAEEMAAPEPGIRLTGPIELGERAKLASITLNVS